MSDATVGVRLMLADRAEWVLVAGDRWEVGNLGEIIDGIANVDDWLHIYRGDQEVFAAPADRVICVLADPPCDAPEPAFEAEVDGKRGSHEGGPS